MDSAVGWVEYAADIAPTPFLHTMDVYMPWWQAALLDVWAAVIGVTLLAVAIIRGVLGLCGVGQKRRRGGSGGGHKNKRE